MRVRVKVMVRVRVVSCLHDIQFPLCRHGLVWMLELSRLLLLLLSHSKVKRMRLLSHTT